MNLVCVGKLVLLALTGLLSQFVVAEAVNFLKRNYVWVPSDSVQRSTDLVFQQV